MKSLNFKVGLILSLALVGNAYAGLFSDDEARMAINEMKVKNDAKFEQQTTMQFELSNQIQKQNDELAKLRGENEVLHHELDMIKKRQQDFYLDLDSRIKKMESSANEAKASQEQAKAQAEADAEKETKDYENALNNFKAQKYKEASWGFSSFVQKYPDSKMAANAQYWLGNSFYALGDCKKAIPAHTVVTTKYAGNSKGSESMLIISTCQLELKQDKEAKNTLEELVAKYPSTSAAEEAKKRLKEMNKKIQKEPVKKGKK